MVRTGPLFGLIAQVGLLTGLAGTTGLSRPGWLFGLACGAVTDLMLSHALGRSGAPRLGPADRVTLLRAILVGGVAALIADAFVRPVHVVALLTLTSIALALDVVDGWVARRTRTVSALGAQFDMEVDAVLILLLSVSVSRTLGSWVLAIGAARYAFVLAGSVWPWLREPAPPRYWCKVVAVVQAITLTVALAGIAPTIVSRLALVGALGLLAESFGRETWWLWRHRAVTPPHRAEHRVAAHASVS
jgi:phosphatidylglycerophosphate synthase